jgi:magnesium transporter
MCIMLKTRIQDLFSRPGREFENLKRELEEAAVHDIAVALPELSAPQQVVAYRLLGKDRAIEVFDQLAPDEQSELVGAMGTPDIAALFEELDPDDRVRLFEELPAKVAKRMVAGFSKETRASINSLMGYPPESAGRAMSPRYLALRETQSCAEALEALRHSELRADELRALFVMDDGRRYRGFVTLIDLLRADARAQLMDVADTAAVMVHADESRLAAARLLQEVDLPAIPVVDAETRMVGAITFDDVIDVLQEEASETMYQKAGIADPGRQRDEIYSQRLTSGSILYPF